MWPYSIVWRPHYHSAYANGWLLPWRQARVGIEGQAVGLMCTLMSWDYWRLADRLAEGAGVVDELRTVPKSFASVEARRRLGREHQAFALSPRFSASGVPRAEQLLQAARLAAERQGGSAERQRRVSTAAGRVSRAVEEGQQSGREGQQSGGGGSAERQGRVSKAAGRVSGAAGEGECCAARAQEYVAVMEPLVLEECGALLLRGHEDAEIMSSSPGVSVAPVQIVRQPAAFR